MIAFDLDDPDFSGSGLAGGLGQLTSTLSSNYLVGSLPLGMQLPSLPQLPQLPQLPLPVPTASCRSFSARGTVLVSSPMSTARVETMRMLNKSQSLSLSSISSLDDAHISFSVANSANSTASTQEPVVSIEELRLQLNSCFTCGVSWHEDHVSLDCQECGGYSLERPCPRCDGRCESTWKRDLTMSHASGKARWEGKCLHTSTQILKNLVTEEESHLCSRLEKLTASS